MMAKQDAIHFSDGKKAVCGSDEPAGKDEQKVKCPECQKWLAERAKQDDDPLIEVKIDAKDLPDGVDWPFSFERPAKLDKKGKVIKSYPIKHYRLISGAKHKLPLSVVEHLENCAYPIKKYKENAPEGQSMVISGMRHRFSISRLGA